MACPLPGLKAGMIARPCGFVRRGEGFDCSAGSLIYLDADFTATCQRRHGLEGSSERVAERYMARMDTWRGALGKYLPRVSKDASTQPSYDWQRLCFRQF